MNSIGAEKLIGIVGPCKSGKSTLKQFLILAKLNVKHISQEHSYSPTMWKIITNPDILIYLEVSYENTIERGKLNWTEKEFNVQVKRLENAKQNADLRIDTNNLSPRDVYIQAKKFIDRNIDILK